MQTLSRKEIIEASLSSFGAILVCASMEEAVEFANELAPEHLEVCAENPMVYLGRLDNAGSVFLGHYSPEPLGDYFAGPNHVLPTSGTARFFSPLSVDSFVKKSSFISYTRDALLPAADDIIRLENLPQKLRQHGRVPAESGTAEAAPARSAPIASIQPLKATVEKAEQAAIQYAIEQCGSVRKAAAALKVDPSTIVRKMHLYKEEQG